MILPLLILLTTGPFVVDPEDPDTAYWVSWFADQDAQHTRVALNNARIYVPQFREIFIDEGVPEDLVWIAWVETHFRPSETSVTGARGIFQFKKETAQFLGLTVNKNRDDRDVPRLAARAAARYLLYLYERFPDWDLVLAAYNLGEGDLRRAMEKQGAVTWPEIKPYVREQTKEYVGKVKAAAVLGNLFMSTSQAYISGRVYRVKKKDSLFSIARRFGIDEDKIRKANGIVGNEIFPGEQLVLPDVSAARQTAPQEGPKKMPVPSQYQVEQGDSLSSISRSLGISVAELKKRNGLKDDHIIPGQILLLHPVGTYEVKRGDTLYSLARKFGVTVDELKKINQLQTNLLQPGQKLKIPTR